MTEPQKNRIIIQSMKKNDGRTHINFNFFKDDYIMNSIEIINLLSNALIMAIKLNQQNLNNKEQAQQLKELITYIETQTFDTDSFKDIESFIKKTP